jgi:hypothetical protein
METPLKFKVSENHLKITDESTGLGNRQKLAPATVFKKVLPHIVLGRVYVLLGPHSMSPSRKTYIPEKTQPGPTRVSPDSTVATLLVASTLRPTSRGCHFAEQELCQVIYAVGTATLLGENAHLFWRNKSTTLHDLDFIVGSN